jgi:hypothetical protein
LCPSVFSLVFRGSVFRKMGSFSIVGWFCHKVQFASRGGTSFIFSCHQFWHHCIPMSLLKFVAISH